MYKQTDPTTKRPGGEASGNLGRVFQTDNAVLTVFSVASLVFLIDMFVLLFFVCVLTAGL